jgi:hypothetical protein
MPRVLSILALACLLVLAGCATQNRADTLDTTLRAYASAVRWGDFQSAMVFLDPKTRADHTPSALDLARYKQVQVSGYDAGSGPVPDGVNQVHQPDQRRLAVRAQHRRPPDLALRRNHQALVADQRTAGYHPGTAVAAAVHRQCLPNLRCPYNRRFTRSAGPRTAVERP